MEPTGRHYWRKIAYFAQDRGYEVKFVRTTALKHQRELDEEDRLIRARGTERTNPAWVEKVIVPEDHRPARTLAAVASK